MATMGDSLAVTAAISGAENSFNGSGLKLGDNGDTGLEESGGNLVVSSTKRVVEVETVVETNCEVETVVETNCEIETVVETNCEIETVVETNCEVEPVNQETDEIVSNRAPDSEVKTAVESLLGHKVEWESGSVNEKTDEIVSNGDKSAPVGEAGVGMIGHGNSSGTSIDCNRAVEVEETVEESSLGCETELHSGPVDQQMDDVSVLNNVNDVGVQTNGNGYSIDNGSVDGLPSGLVNQQADVVSTVNSVASEDCVENNGNGYSIDTGAEECQDSDLDDGDAMDITVSQLKDTKGFRKGTVDAEGKQQDHGFRVGDFVWGKIKSHPWWPGQIYDTKDASDDAQKCSHEGRLLVAFFGDASYSWCLPSQLKPFVDNFDDMSTGSQSGSFLHAIREAVNEIGRIVETGMVCRCMPEEKRVGLARPVVENAGIRAGVLMPEVESCRVSVPEFEPIELVSELRQFAVAGHVDNALDLAMMRSWLSAFYRLKCGGQLPIYHDPLPIEGMEDQDQNVTAIDNDLSVAIEAPASGPADWLSSPTKTQPDEKNSHKRKLKSIAELIGKNTSVKRKSRKKATGKEATDLVIETSLLKGKKSDDSSSGKISSKRKNSVSESSEIANNTVSNAETSNRAGIYGTSQGSLSEKPKEIKLTPAEATPREEKDAFEALSSPRERKKSKYLSPPYTNVTWRMGYLSFKSYTEIEPDNKKSKKVNKTQATEEDGLLERVDVSNVKSPEAVKDDKQLSFSVSDVDAPVDALLSKIQCAAVNPFYLSRDGSFDMVFAFCSALRKSTYAHESDYKTLRNHKGSIPRKRKLSSLQCEIPQNDEKSPKPVKAEELAKGKKKKAKPSGLESNAGDAARKFAPSLIMIFKPGTALPSKEDIVDHYSKFGRLFEHDTRVLPDSQLVQIVFMKEAEATKAFEASMQDNSFGFENLLCDMLQTSPRSRSGAPCLDASAPEQEEVSHDLASDARAMASKLMLMSTTLEKYHSKFSEDDKLMLKEEMKRLKEKAVNVCKAVETISELRGA